MPAPRAMSAPFATLSMVDTASAATAIASMDSPATWEPDQKMMPARMPADGRSRLAPGLHLGEGADGAAARVRRFAEFGPRPIVHAPMSRRCRVPFWATNPGIHGKRDSGISRELGFCTRSVSRFGRLAGTWGWWGARDADCGGTRARARAQTRTRTRGGDVKRGRDSRRGKWGGRTGSGRVKGHGRAKR